MGFTKIRSIGRADSVIEHGAAFEQLCAAVLLSNLRLFPNCSEAFWKRASAGGVTATVTVTGFDPAVVSGSNPGCGGTFTMYKSRRALFANEGNTIQLPSGSGDVVSSSMKVRGACSAISAFVSTRLRLPEGSK